MFRLPFSTTLCKSFLWLNLFLFLLIIENNAQSFSWVTRIGSPIGSNVERGNAVTTDNNGNVISTGSFAGTADFDPGPGILNLTAGGAADIYIQKLDPAGNLIWAKQAGGPSGDQGTALITDAAGNVFVTGSFVGTADFDPGPGTYNLTSFGGGDAFILKLDAAGNFVFALQIGGAYPTLTDIGYGIKLDGSGNIYTTGHFRETGDFDPGPSVYNMTAFGISSNEDVFVLKLDPNGNFIWAKQLGGNSTDEGKGLSIDPTGNVLITGLHYSTGDFDPGPGTYTLNDPTFSGNIFICKLTNAGDFLWAFSIGAQSTDQGSSITTDALGNVYATGRFANTVDFDPGPSTSNLTAIGTSGNTFDAFIVKYSSSGNFLWAKQLGGEEWQEGLAIALDGSNNIYTSGFFTNTTDFDPGPGNFSLTAAGSDVFVSKLDPSGNFIWAVGFGGNSSEQGRGITVDQNQNVYTTGYFNETVDFDPGTGVVSVQSLGAFDIFVQKLIQLPCTTPPQPGAISGNINVCQGIQQVYSISPVPGATYYSWSLPAGWTGNSNTTTITATPGANGGSISVSAGVNCGIGPMQQLAVTVIPLPAQPVNITGNTSVCNGSNQAYSISPVPGATSYTWTIPSGWTGTSTSSSINLLAGPSGGELRVRANNACGSGPEQVLALTVYELPAQPTAISGAATVCTGFNYTYSVSPIAGATGYLWTIPSGWTGTSATNSINVTAGNNAGNITVRAMNVCGNGPLQTLAITTQQPLMAPSSITGPTAVVIGQTTNYSISPVSGASGYQWGISGGGVINSGQNTTTISVTWNTTGNHTLSINAVNACGPGNTYSTGITVSTATGIVNPDNRFELLAVPNPFKEEVQIRIKNAVAKACEFSIINSTGQVLLSQIFKPSSNDHLQQLNLSHVPSGIYILKIKIGTAIYTRSLVKQ